MRWFKPTGSSYQDRPAVVPGVGRGDQVGGGEQPVQQVEPRSLLTSDQGLALAFLPAVTVGGGRSPLQSTRAREGPSTRIIREIETQLKQYIQIQKNEGIYS